MKGFGRGRKLAYRASEIAYAIAAFSSAVLGVATGANTSDGWLAESPITTKAIQSIQSYAIPAYIVVCVIVVISFLYRRLGDPWVLEKIKFILDEYQGKAFKRESGDPADHHRITLFKFKKNCLFVRHWSSTRWYKPWGNKPIFSNYLVPIMRSGHLSQKSTAIFYISDNSDDCEGVAAKAWSSGEVALAFDLPPLPPANPKARDIATYAALTNTDKQFIQKYMTAKRQMPRSIAAIPVTVFGETWGVIVLDSRLPDGVSSDSVLNYELTVALVGQLLEKAP